MQITKTWLVVALGLNSVGVMLGIWVNGAFALLSLAPPIAAFVFDAYSPPRFGR